MLIFKVDHQGKRVRIEYKAPHELEREWINIRVIYDVQRV